MQNIGNALLVAVSKYRKLEEIKDLYDKGQRDFGENYVEEVILKAEKLPKDIQWHFIGHLQSNKVRKLLSAIPNIIIQTVDSKKLIEMLNNYENCKIFIQVNISNEVQKSGFKIDEVDEAISLVLKCSNLKLQGLMMIGSQENPEFAQMNDLRNQLELKFGLKLKLSMGMSGDYKIALENGSDIIRIGTLLFGDRPMKIK